MSPSSKPSTETQTRRGHLERSDRQAVKVATCMLGVAAVGATAALLAAGVRLGPVEAAAPDPAPAPIPALQVAAGTIPALQVPTRLLTEPGQGLRPDGSLAGAAPTPWPMGCQDVDIQPLSSQSRAITHDDGRVQVTVQSYAPGAGAAAFAAQRKAATECRPDGVWSMDQAGTEQAGYSAAKSGTTVQGTSLRTGDVIVHVTGPRGAAQQVALTLDQSLDQLLAEVCAEPGSTAADFARNPLAPEPAPYRVDHPVTIADPGMPPVPVNAGYQATELPASLPGLEEATPMAEPDWPVWPPMPQDPGKPTAPAAPAASPVLEGTIAELRDDIHGPGCGWDWTGQAPSVFDAAAAETANTQAEKDKTGELKDGAQDWSRQVLDYWSGVAEYTTAATAWNHYAAEVLEVNAAWEQINADWKDYLVAKAEYDTQQEQIARFGRDQDAAQSTWREDLEQCEAENEEIAEESIKALNAALRPSESESPSPSPSPSPSSSKDREKDEDGPSASPSPQPSPSPSLRERVDCDRQNPRPAILDVEPPDPLPEPVEPADPRPAGHRG